MITIISFSLFIIVSLVCVHIVQRKQRKKCLKENDISSFSEPMVEKNKFKIPKDTVFKYVPGYIRFVSILVGYIPSHHIRNFLYRYVFLLDMKEKVVIYYGAEIRAHFNVHIGKGSIIGDKAVLDGRRGGIYIGENVNFSSFVHLWTGQHDYKDPYFRSMPGRRGPIRIEDRAWIGPNVTILHSVTIGEGAVIAAGAVVTKDVAPYSVVGGIPAKVIGERPRNLKYEFTGKYTPFF